MKKISSLLFALLLLLSSFSVNIHADESKYKVFMDEGLYGAVTTVKEVPDGTVLGFGTDATTGDYLVYEKGNIGNVFYRIQSTNEKYYVKGVHISGHYLDEEELCDNDENVTVNEDLYLVASYGVKGDQYSYKVYYYTEDGQNLMTLSGESEECDTFYSYVDEKVIVGARVFDGYEDYIVVRGTWTNGGGDVKYDGPTKGFTGTVTDNGTVIEYYYRQVIPGEVITYDETVIYEPGTGGGGGGAGGGGGTAPVTPETPEIIDIDEPEVPQTEPETPNENQGDNQGEEIIEPEPVPTTNWWQELVSKPWLLAGSGLALGMLLFFLAFLFKRRKEND